MAQSLKIYISYSLNNTNKNTLKEIESVLISKGYEVTHYIQNEEYDTYKLDNADFVLFIGKYVSDLADNTSLEYLSRGQYTELERSITNNKPIGFYVEHHEKDELLVSKFITKQINDSKDWKHRYAVAYTKVQDDGYAPDIDYFVAGLKYWNTTTSNNLLLLL